MNQILFLCLGVHNFLQLSHKLIEGHGAQIAVGTVTRRNGTVFHVVVAHNYHVGDLLQLSFTDLFAELLIFLKKHDFRTLVLCGGKVSGIVDARTTTKEEVGLLMTKLGGKEAN